eukprot:1306776-Alexandrium_andersonii.AAC.1
MQLSHLLDPWNGSERGDHHGERTALWYTALARTRSPDPHGEGGESAEAFHEQRIAHNHTHRHAGTKQHGVHQNTVDLIETLLNVEGCASAHLRLHLAGLNQGRQMVPPVLRTPAWRAS